ncbi:MAG: hypothetical protein R3359_08695 [Marinirhabdus sp.]|nr:hypothetical protein [Marinirhabdus sp.]
MSKTLRITLITIGSIIGIFLIALVVGNLIVKNKIEKFVTDGLPDHISAHYADLDLHLITGTITFSNIAVSLQNMAEKSVHTQVETKKLVVEDFKYWDYLFNDQIHLETIQITNPKIDYYSHRYSPPADSTTTDTNNNTSLKRSVLIDKLSLDHAKITMYDDSKDSTSLYVADIMVTIDSMYFDQETIKNRIPVTYTNYSASTDSIFLKVGAYEHLKTGPLQLKNRQLTVDSLRLATKYSIPQHTKMLEKERDHFDVSAERLAINNVDFGFKGKQFFSETSKIVLDRVDATFYRNKLVEDDNTEKPLYSKMLRDLPIALTVDSLLIQNSSIRYEEKVKSDQPAGAIYFNELNANIENVGNTYPKKQSTNIHITSQFMRSTPVTVDWSFQVHDKSDAFTFKGDVGPLRAEQMNAFTKPNLRASLEGKVDQTFFSIYGNRNQSDIDMRIKYDEFSVDLLKEDGTSTKTLLSGLVNLFVSSESENDSEGFTKGSATVQPDKTKSFFNYLWLNVRDALKKCLM